MSRIDLTKHIKRYLNYFSKIDMSKLPKIYKNISLYIKKHKNGAIIIVFALPAVFMWGLVFYRYFFLPQPAKLQNLGEKSNYYFQGSSKTYQLSIGDRKTNEPKVEFSLSSSQDKSVTFYPASARDNLEKPIKKNNKIIFKNVYANTDYTYEPTTNGVKEEIVVNKANDISIYPFFLDLKGVTPKYFATNIAGGVFYDENKNYLFHFEKPFAVDARGVRTDNVNISIKKDTVTNKLVAILGINKAWTNSPERVYPITIDPTVVHDTTAEFATGQMNRVKDIGTGYITGATGGTITYKDGYTIHTFTSDGAFTPSVSGNVEVLVVAGGGGGGGPGSGEVSGRGGGGAGGVLYNSSYAVTSSPITITVGSGGGADTNGNNSVFGTLTAIGGGRGATTGTTPGNGGSGGGGNYNNGGYYSGSYHGSPGTGTAGQGNNGGYGFTDAASYSVGGGGGGAGAVGGGYITSGNPAGAGGIGTAYSISGNLSYYGGGGGGGGDHRQAYAIGGAGGTGGGGAGATSNGATGTAGTANTGGGGGGGAYNGTGGAGGSGIVIVRYPTGPNIFTNYQELSADQNTVGLWHMDELADNSCSSGEDACDSSGRGHHGIDSGGSVITTGKLNNARGFDSSDRIYMTASTDYEFGTKDFTVEAWVNFKSAITTYRNVISNYNPGWILGTDSNGQMAFYDSGTWRSPAIPIPTGWHHWAISRTGSNLNFYLDGKYKATVTGVTTNIAGGFDELQIGKNDEWTSYFQDFDIDEVRISNAARTSEEIKLAAQRRPYGVYTSDVVDLTAVGSWNSLTWTESGVATGDGETPYSNTGLVAQWNFNETSGTTADNAEGTSALDGTLTNFASTASQDQAAGTGWTANNKRWGAGALMFGGNTSNNFVDAGTNSSLKPNSVTVESWINPNVTDAVFRAIISSRANGSTTSGYLLSYGDVAGKVYFRVTTNCSTWGATLASNTTLQTGQWYHIVATYTSGTTNLYINGVLDTTSTAATGNLCYDSDSLRIGGDSNANSYKFSGVIDSTRIYSRTVTPSEILSNYNSANLEIQTRVGASADPNDGTWEDWKPNTTVETVIDAMDNPMDWTSPLSTIWSGVPIATSSSSVIKAEGNASLKAQVGIPKVDANTVGLWHLDETSGTGAYIKDSTANANHGTPTGTSLTQGISGKARSFAGSGNYITIPSNPSLQLTDTLTLEGWINPNTADNDGILYKGNFAGSQGNYQITMLNNTIYCRLNNDAVSFASTYALPNNTWSHFACTYDKNAGSSQVKLYINGQLNNTATYSTSVSTSDTGLYIGAYVSSTYAFSGLVDEVRVSNATKTAEEIAEAYRAGRDHRISKTISSTDLSSSTKIPFQVAADRPGTYLEATIGESAFANYEPDANTAALIHMDEEAGSGAYIKDSSGNNNHGTPTGATFAGGKIGKARYFDNSNDVIDLGSGSSLDFGNNGPFTLSGWINPTTLGDYDAFISKVVAARNGTYSYMTVFMANGRLAAYTGSAWVDVCPAGSVAAGKWSHVAFVYNGTTLYGYVNGNLCGSVAFTYTDNAAHNVFIGSWYVTSQLYDFNGVIDEARVDNVARTADQIRQAYEVGARSHQITIDFGAKLDSGNLIADSNDKSFTVDATYYGLNQKGSNLYLGDKIIIKENYDGTEYLAQGTVNAITASTGATTVSAWDAGSTFPSGGFTVNASVFKWQREYFDITSSLSTHRDATTKITLRLTNGGEGRNIWLDDFKYVSSYLTNPATTGNVVSSTGNRYFQYRAVETSSDYNVTPSLNSITLDYISNSTPTTPSLDLPTDTATSQSSTPALKTTTTDADSDYLRYKILLCTNSDMTVNCQTFDQTSSQTGWSGQDTQSDTAYASGTQAVYTIQSALDPGTTYYWKSYAIDPAGSNTWSPTQGSAYSFTTNQKPNTPSLDLPTDTAVNQSFTPIIKTTATDPDTPADYLKYKITLCTDSTMTANCQTFDQTSSQTGWSEQDTQSDTAYASGTQAVYTIQSALASATTYYWKSYAIDPAGSNTWSSTQGSPYSFMTTAAPSFPLLLQTEGLSNPMAITNQTPNFTAICNDANGGDILNKYQIQVSTDPTFSSTTWDSGSSGTAMTNCTAGDRSSNLAYGGSALALDGVKYFWRIKFWDAQGAEGPFSNTTNLFTMASQETMPAPSSCRIKEVADDGTLTLIWNDNSTGETQFRIEKNVDSAGFNFLTNKVADSTSHVDSDVSAGHTYQYQLRAEGATNSSYCITNILNLQLGVFEIKGLNFKGLILD